MHQTSEDEKFIKTEILIPMREDKSFGTSELHSHFRWQLFKKKIFILFDGYTQCPGTYKGAWRDPDTKSKIDDDSLKFEVAVKENELEKMRDLIKNFVGPLFRQKVICLTVKGNIEFIESNRRMVEKLP